MAIFSNTKVADIKAQLTEAQTKRAEAEKKVTELEAQLKTASESANTNLESFKSQLETEFQAKVESVKTEFTNEIAGLKTQIAALTKEKEAVTIQAFADVEKAKEIKQSEVNAQVAAKVASIGLTEDTLPPKVSDSQPNHSRFKIIRQES